MTFVESPPQLVIVQGLGGPQGVPGPQGTAGTPGATGAAGVAFPPVASVAPANVALTGLQTLDGVAGAVNQRVFLPFQTTQSQNGLWLQQTGAWTRPTDFPTGGTPGAYGVLVLDGGNIYGRSLWALVSTGVTIGTTSQLWQIMTLPNVRAGVHMVNSQSIINNTDVLVAFDTKDYDSGGTPGFFSTSTHLFTCPFAGWYRVSGGLLYNIANSIEVVCNVRKNGSRILAPWMTARGPQIGREVQCAVNDTLSLNTAQISGATQSLWNAESGSANHMEIALVALT